MGHVILQYQDAELWFLTFPNGGSSSDSGRYGVSVAVAAEAAVAATAAVTTKVYISISNFLSVCRISTL
jgi:hypothetical protein